MNQADPSTTAVSSDRKTAILDAALAVFSEKGVGAATIDDIRLRSQSSVGSIYHHFGTKESIAATLFMRGLDDYWGSLNAAVAVAPHAERAIHALVSTHIAWIIAHPDLSRFMFARRQAVSPAHEQAVRQCTAEHFRRLFDVFKPWFQQGILRRLPNEMYGPLLMGPSQELARQWLAGNLQLDLPGLVDDLSGAAWRSLAVDPAAIPHSHQGART